MKLIKRCFICKYFITKTRLGRNGICNMHNNKAVFHSLCDKWEVKPEYLAKKKKQDDDRRIYLREYSKKYYKENNNDGWCY